MEQHEEWRDIHGYEGMYQVSNLGRIKSLRNKEELVRKIWHEPGAYCSLTLTGKGRRHHVNVHRLVAIAFCANPKELAIVNHKNGLKHDNRAQNLEWVSHIDNFNHAVSLGLTKPNVPVDQYSLDGVFIRRFVSLSEASRTTGIKVRTIRNCIKGVNRKPAAFLWIYT